MPLHVPTLDAIGRGLGVTLRRRHLHTILGLCLFEAAFYVAYRFGMSFSQAAASPFWFPDSILLCALLIAPPRLWWLLIILPLPVRLFSEVAAGVPTWFLLATYAVDSAKGLAAALALRRVIGQPFRLESVREVGFFFLFAVLLVPAGGAFLGAAVRGVAGHEYWLSWEQWFLGDALAQMVITPVIFHWLFSIPWRSRDDDLKRHIEAMAVALGLIVTGYIATNAGASAMDFAGARFYLPVPFMFWAAIRFGMRGASGAVGIVAVLAVHGALTGRGPFSNLSPSDITLALQNFLLLRSAPLYLVAAVIAQRRDVEARLRESEDRFRNMANNAPVLLWIAGRDTKCEFVNQGWLDFIGQPLHDLLGHGWLQAMHPEDKQHTLDVYHAAFAARQPFEVEYRLRRSDGEYRWIVHKGKVRTAPDGEFLGYVGSAIDITDRKQVEEGTRMLSHAQRLVVMGELSAAIAHEVRQPLSAILSNADTAVNLLNAANPPLDEIKEIVSDIREDDLRANDVVSRIREFLRAQTVPTQAIDLNASVTDALRLVAADARRRRVRIRSELAVGLPSVPADRTQVLQVLTNLLVNGLDAMDEAPPWKRWLIVRTASDGNEAVEFAVEDHGSGIAPDRLARLFEPFFTTKSAGMGLGLSIARSIVVAHGGRIWAVNNPNGGATFHFTLPVSQGPTAHS